MGFDKKQILEAGGTTAPMRGPLKEFKRERGLQAMGKRYRVAAMLAAFPHYARRYAKLEALRHQLKVQQVLWFGVRAVEETFEEPTTLEAFSRSLWCLQHAVNKFLYPDEDDCEEEE